MCEDLRFAFAVVVVDPFVSAVPASAVFDLGGYRLLLFGSMASVLASATLVMTLPP